MSDRVRSRRGRQPVRDAAAEYQRRHGRNALDDATYGLVFAAEAELQRWMDDLVRAMASGDGTGTWAPLPAWCRNTLLQMDSCREAGVPEPPFLRGISSAMLVQICQDPPVPALCALVQLRHATDDDPACLERMLAEATRQVMHVAGAKPAGPIVPAWPLLAPLLQTAGKFSADARAHARSHPRPARRPVAGTLRAFHRGVSLHFATMGERPRPSDLALLSAAAGLEPLHPNLDRLTMKWRDRCRMWTRRTAGSPPSDNSGNKSA